jgi:hypothetical protein
MALAMLVSLPALSQDNADTRTYAAKTPTGLSLKLDLALPAALPQPGQLDSNTQPVPPAALGIEPPDQPQQPAAWPYVLLGLLALGGSAAWFLRRERKPVPAAAPYLQPDRHVASPSPFMLDVEPREEEAAPVSAYEQFETSIQLLKEHIAQNPGESPVPWLLLLDLLHRTSKEQEYEETRRQCKQHFNVEMPQYKKIKTASKRQGIESYPHIMSKLIRLWPGEEAAAYLNALLHDSRDGSRVGFDLATYHDIALLRSVLESVSVPAQADAS